jgi:hypothetical protein
MDDFLLIRFALDNVHPPSLGEGARAAFNRVKRWVTLILAMERAMPACGATRWMGDFAIPA